MWRQTLLRCHRGKDPCSSPCPRSQTTKNSPPEAPRSPCVPLTQTLDVTFSCLPYKMGAVPLGHHAHEGSDLRDTALSHSSKTSLGQLCPTLVPAGPCVRAGQETQPGGGDDRWDGGPEGPWSGKPLVRRDGGSSRQIFNCLTTFCTVAHKLHQDLKQNKKILRKISGSQLVRLMRTLLVANPTTWKHVGGCG